jgi:hypothetical protein
MFTHYVMCSNYICTYGDVCTVCPCTYPFEHIIVACVGMVLPNILRM